MQGRDFEINITKTHRIRFTHDVFEKKNRLLADTLETNGDTKILTFIDKGFSLQMPSIFNKVAEYLYHMPGCVNAGIYIFEGGETAKNNKSILNKAWKEVARAKMDRHSYVFAIGGGAFLDVIGMVAATAHRGVRLVRFPTTTLSQDDSGSGVKNGINSFGKKNFLGTFSVPYAVFNDFCFLQIQKQEKCREGIIEAIKVALVKDSSFFEWIENNYTPLSRLKTHTLEELVERSALLHASHIAYGGDPFEEGSSRPLDFGHWSAHKMEQLTDFSLSHAMAVSVGLALDTVYSMRIGWLEPTKAKRILKLLTKLGLPIWHECLEIREETGKRSVYQGIEEFREHLGGKLTVLMLKDIGKGDNVHSLDSALLNECIESLKNDYEIALV